MKISNVMLIFSREIRDQLRDRRTLFTVLILPLVLYPLMGMAMLQVSQFMREHPTRIWIVGTENLPENPALIHEGQFEATLLEPGESALIELELSTGNDQRFHRLVGLFKESQHKENASKLVDRLIQLEMAEREIDLAVFVPQKIHSANSPRDEAPTSEREPTKNFASLGGSPTVYVFRNSAADKSNMAAERLNKILGKWQQNMFATVLKQKNIDQSAIEAFQVAHADVAEDQWKQAATWSKILPFVLMIWCLTGAFYPAVDLCAGEKERGTFETLLSSPARRDEIAIGKLLTVMTFSIVTSLLNLVSMGFTGIFVMSRLGAGLAAGAGFGIPPVESVGWLLLALLPISAFFSAVALAAASFARSSKEGQYYLVPLMMISMPLMMLPMLPAAELDLGTSLIPVSGLMMLLRSLIEGRYTEAIQFAGPVCAVTLVCCWLAIRWVVNQFNSESVLFRPSERFGIGAWFRHVMRDRHALPSMGHAILCGVLILILKFFVGLVIQPPTSWMQFSKQTIVVLLATVGTPAVLMAIVLTKRPGLTLRLRKCSLAMAFTSVILAVCMHPMIMWITSIVIQLYPPTGDMHLMQQMMNSILADSPGTWAIVFVFAVAPAITEELAFRGFILSGMQSLRSDWKAILLTSLLFGVAHSVLQQSIITFFVGMLLGFLAVRTGSLLPCILYHATHNALSVLLSMGYSESANGLFGWLLVSSDGSAVEYRFWPATVLTCLGFLLIAWIWKGGGEPETKGSGDVDPSSNLPLREMLDSLVNRLSNNETSAKSG